MEIKTRGGRALARARLQPRFPSRALLLLFALHSINRAEVLDRIAVSVNQQVITESDLIRDLRVDAFIDQKPVNLSPDARREAAQRLVDQILILKEAEESHLTLASPEDATKLVEQEKSKYSPGAASAPAQGPGAAGARSEERRVGKEC